MTAPSLLAVPYATLINAKIVVSSIKKPYLAVDEHFFRFCMRSIIDKIKIDEKWYLSRYPDVAEAMGEEGPLSAAEHFIKHGYYENRMPYEIIVEEAWYLDQYPDVLIAVRNGDFASAQAHFEGVGYAEGRFPYPNFSLLTAATASETAATDYRKFYGLPSHEQDTGVQQPLFDREAEVSAS